MEIGRGIWESPGEEVLVEAVGLSKLAGGETEEMKKEPRADLGGIFVAGRT